MDDIQNRRRLIDGRPVAYEDRRVPVSDLVLDPKNPRIQYEIRLKLRDPISDEQLDGLMWERDQVKRLKAAIKQAGGVSEPLFVRQRPDGRLLVLEGNQRTVAVRHQLRETPDDPRFHTVPAWIFGEDLTSGEIAVLLADLHVAGKDQWRPYEQAKHIFELSDTFGKSYDWLATHLRLSKSQVMQKIAAYRAFTDFLNEVGGEDPSKVTKYSFFEELYKKKLVREPFEGDAEFRRRFKQWINIGRLTDAKDVRDLPVILDSVKATEALESGGIDAARRILIQEDPSLGSDLLAAVKGATQKIKDAPVSEVQSFKEDPRKIVILRDLNTAIANLATLAGVSL